MENLLPFEKGSRGTVTRKEYLTSDKFGFRPEERDTDALIKNGVINIDKPSGPTSHQVSAFVQEILGIKKAGHSGTLDPKVTGVLAVATEKATRMVGYLLTSGKEYVCLMHLHEDYDEYKIRKVIASFVGEIDQMPPVKSAVKRQIRQRKIYYIKVHEIIGRDVLFTVGCQAGTYIRKLCHDIGLSLGSGAHMAQLIRTKAGPFRLKDSWTLQDLKDAMYYYKEEANERFIRKIVLPLEKAVEFYPKIWVMDTAVDPLCHGSDLAVPGISKLTENIRENEVIAIMTLKDELICMGRARMDASKMMGEKGVAVKTEKVFMDPGVYPKYVKSVQKEEIIDE